MSSSNHRPTDNYDHDPLSDSVLLIRSIAEAKDLPSTTKSKYCRPPRLGIIHLLSWITCSAIMLKLCVAMEAIGPFAPKESPSNSLIRNGFTLGMTLNCAAGIVGACILWRTKKRDPIGQFQPGHWILMIDSIMIIFCNIMLFLASMIIVIDHKWQFQHFGGINALSYIIGSFGCGYYVREMNESGRWLLFFKSLCVYRGLFAVFFLGAVNHLFFTTEFLFAVVLSGIFVSGVFVYSVLTDIKHHSRRDWLHWLGICTLSLSTCLMLVATIGMWIITQNAAK